MLLAIKENTIELGSRSRTANFFKALVPARSLLLEIRQVAQQCFAISQSCFTLWLTDKRRPYSLCVCRGCGGRGLCACARLCVPANPLSGFRSGCQKLGCLKDTRMRDEVNYELRKDSLISEMYSLYLTSIPFLLTHS